MDPNDANITPPKGAPGGKVGFFWIVPDRLGHDAILGEAFDLAKAETYGEALTHPLGHYDYWTLMKARGPAWLRARNLSGSLLTTEYEDWPRGRLVFFPAQERFTLLADRRIFRSSRLNLVWAMFQVAEHRVDLRRDGHYMPIGRSASA
ncbi:hypothetical protein [Mesorhizobium shangrilense]|uniref:Uncharacterized protein n=1 Tax=Mesorhizobium shangrilense TaxID=460060 RepID=A0ABV2DHE4_9HYPH